MRRGFGWKLMGFPYQIGYGRFVINTPLWRQIYRLGAWLHNR